MKFKFQSERDRAVAYAAYKQLERMLKVDGEMEPGTYEDVSFERLEIVLPKGTIVERDRGTNGDGTIYKTATQNLYGYAVLAACAIVLKKFNQWGTVRKELLAAVKRAVIKGNETSEELKKNDKDFAKFVEELRKELQAEPREESTPRVCKDTGLFPTISFFGRKQKAS